jgi:hypothetical protein
MCRSRRLSRRRESGRVSRLGFSAQQAVCDPGSPLQMTLQGGRFARIRAQVRLRLLTGEPEFVFRGFWLPTRDLNHRPVG